MHVSSPSSGEMAVATGVAVLIWCQKNSTVVLQNRHIDLKRVTPARYNTCSTSSIFFSRSASTLDYTATSWTCNITTLSPCTQAEISDLWTNARERSTHQGATLWVHTCAFLL